MIKIQSCNLWFDKNSLCWISSERISKKRCWFYVGTLERFWHHCGFGPSSPMFYDDGHKEIKRGLLTQLIWITRNWIDPVTLAIWVNTSIGLPALRIIFDWSIIVEYSNQLWIENEYFCCKSVKTLFWCLIIFAFFSNVTLQRL